MSPERPQYYPILPSSTASSSFIQALPLLERQLPKRASMSAISSTCTNQTLHYNPWNILSTVASRTRAAAVSDSIFPRVLSTKEALSASLSPKASNCLPIPNQLFVQCLNSSWTQTAHAGRSRDIELYIHDQDLPGLYPEIIVVGASNTIIMEEPDGQMTLHSPSRVLEALACVNAPCILFLRDTITCQLRYKGTYMASQVTNSERVGYLSFGTKDQARIVNMTARLVGEPEDYVRDEYRAGMRQLNAYKLEYVEWKGVAQFRQLLQEVHERDKGGEIDRRKLLHKPPPPRRSQRIRNWPQRLPSMFVDLPPGKT